MKFKSFLFLGMFFFLLQGVPLQAQQMDTLPPPIDTLVIDSLEEVEIAVLESGYPNPKKALLFSIVPGGGQLYNKRWWKVPLVYGAIIGFAYNIDYNQGLYRRFRTAYALKLQGEDTEFTVINPNLDNLNTLRTLRDKYDKNTQLSYVYLVLVYALQGVEAFVDAHLRHFDVEDDIGIRLKPDIDYNTVLGQPVIGLGVSIPLHGKTAR